MATRQLPDLPSEQNTPGPWSHIESILYHHFHRLSRGQKDISSQKTYSPLSKTSIYADFLMDQIINVVFTLHFIPRMVYSETSPLGRTGSTSVCHKCSYPGIYSFELALSSALYSGSPGCLMVAGSPCLKQFPLCPDHLGLQKLSGSVGS